MGIRTVPASLLVLIFGSAFGYSLEPEPMRLRERFDPPNTYRVTLQVDILGELTIPATKEKPAQTLGVVGSSRLQYDERVLPSDGTTGRTARVYREVAIRRTVAGKDQEADIRPSVRRMIVLRSAAGKKAPFSPDGPLTWGEIDVVRTDIFSPALVSGLLPPTPVRPGDSWVVATPAVAELTDLDPVSAGELRARFLSTIVLNGRSYAKLAISGSVTGLGQDGTGRHKLDGIGYFDLDFERLTYLNLKGTHELLGPDGQVQGHIAGKFVLTREGEAHIAELADTLLRERDWTPGPENTLLLYENAELGIRFLYPRRWRVGAVRGQQLTIEESRGGGILLTLEPADKLPTAEQLLAETRAYLRSQKWTVTAVDPPRPWTDRVSRFALNADTENKPVRMEYAVWTGDGGGIVVAARLPWAEREELQADVDRILKSLSRSGPMKK
ncbi:MAG: hypothetical protein LC104_16650 [Bacteroidales bacterium]|nr:hypothetical protein [Bacteroidales bacterium]